MKCYGTQQKTPAAARAAKVGFFVGTLAVSQYRLVGLGKYSFSDFDLRARLVMKLCSIQLETEEFYQDNTFLTR